VQPTSALLLWLFLRSTLLPHEPASLALPVSPLPSARSAYGWLETTAPQIVSSEFDAGGLLVGRSAKIGVHGTSAIDTTFRFGGLDVTSMLRPGTPMVQPDVVGAASFDVTRIGNDVTTNAPGPVVEWKPVDGSQRVGVIEGFFMPSGLAAKPGGGAQPVAELRSFADGSVLLAGELQPNRSSAALSVHWARAESVDRSMRAGRLPAAQIVPAPIQRTSLSLLGHFAYTPAPDNRASLTMVIQRGGEADVDRESHGALDGAWQRRLRNGIALRAAAGYQWMQVGLKAPAPLLEMDSAFDGAVFPRAFAPAGREHALRFSADAAKTFPIARVSHQFLAGLSVDRSAMDPTLAQAATIAESVNGQLARIWHINVPATAPHWTASTAGMYAQDRIGNDDIWFEAGVRLDRLGGHNGGATSISWTNLFPRVAINIFDKGAGMGVFGSYTRSGARLPAMALAYGDVNAPTASIYKPVPVTQPPLIARMGPGAAGGLTKISPDLMRPVYDTVMGGLKYERPQLTASVTAIIRTTTHSMSAINDSPSNYTVVTQLDNNADFTDSSDDKTLIAYNRKTATFGLDSYTLSNLTSQGETIYALDITAQYRGKRARVAFSAAAVGSKGTTASRGFRADENDPMLIGEAFANPNASLSAANGRTFFDRGYVGKVAGAFKLPGRAELGIVTRYQDGQPFSRLAIVDNLNQGPEPVMAYRNGRPTRFTYISTTDVRLQKVSTFGAQQLTLIIDGFNVFNIGREVAEYVVGDARFRTTSLIEPPRTIRLGVRIAF